MPSSSGTGEATMEQGQRVRGWLRGVRGGDLGALPVLVGLGAMALVFQWLAPTFLSPTNLGNLAVQIVPTGLIALGDRALGDDLRLVDGWLLEGSVLAETKNESLHEADADRRLAVVVGDGVTRANVVPGPFLVRPAVPLRSGSPVWQVVVQVPHQPIIRVSSP